MFSQFGANFAAVQSVAREFYQKRLNLAGAVVLLAVSSAVSGCAVPIALNGRDLPTRRRRWRLSAIGRRSHRIRACVRRRRHRGGSLTTASRLHRSPETREGAMNKIVRADGHFTLVRRLRTSHVAALLSALALSGCATFSPDTGMSVVAGVAGTTIKKDVVAVRSEEQAGWVRAATQRLLRRPLTVDTSVQVALLNNKGLQASYNELALAEADMVEQSLPPNPTFSISRIAGGGAVEIERQVVGDILALATLPFRSEIARQRFQQAQLRAALETLRLAADVRRAYYRAVAANELVGLLTDAKATAESTAKLASKLGETGSLNKLDQAREQVFYAETTADLATARQDATSSRERLIRLLGLWDGDLGFQT